MKSSTLVRARRPLAALGLVLAAGAVIGSAGGASAVPSSSAIEPAGATPDVQPVAPVTDLELDKVVSTAPARVGDPISYSIVVTNHGPDFAPQWTMTDAIPTAVGGASTTTPGCAIVGGTLTCTGNNLAAGASWTIVLTGTATQVGPIVNTATVTTNRADSNAANNTDTATVTVLGTPVVHPWMAAGLAGLAGLGVVGARVRPRRATR